jgi:hypothetical protein
VPNTRKKASGSGTSTTLNSVELISVTYTQEVLRSASFSPDKSGCIIGTNMHEEGIAHVSHNKKHSNRHQHKRKKSLVPVITRTRSFALRLTVEIIGVNASQECRREY